MLSKPLEKWAHLRASKPVDGVNEISSLTIEVNSGYGHLRFAIGPNGEPRLLVPCGPDVTLKEVTSNGRLELTLSRLRIDSKSAQFIDVICVTRTLDSVFAELANEIINRISLGEGPAKAVEGAITDFRSLLSDDEVPDHQILGLIGELVVLRELAKYCSTAADAWTGPLGQRHDFRRGTYAIEVKTSGRADSTLITVSSIEQLTEPSEGILHLLHIKAECTDHGPLTISALYSELLSLGCPQALLIQRIKKLGCTNPSLSAWNRFSYALEGMDAYQVVEGFPRISTTCFEGGKLPDGIHTVSYTVDLLAAKDFMMSTSDRNNLFRKMMA